MTKKSKASVEYTGGRKDVRCGACDHYRHNSGTCALVEGKIEPWMRCRLFKAER